MQNTYIDRYLLAPLDPIRTTIPGAKAVTFETTA